jgi:hypothetical protein
MSKLKLNSFTEIGLFAVLILWALSMGMMAS